MGFSQISGSVDDAVFEVLGDPAVWTSADGETVLDGVMVIAEEGDQLIGSNSSRFVGAKRILQVRKSEVEAPEGGKFTLATGEQIQVIGKPLLDAEGAVWSCEGAAPR